MGWGPDVAVSCGVGCRLGSDPALLWLWCRPVATALIGALAWEPPYVMGVALERQKLDTHTHTKDVVYIYTVEYYSAIKRQSNAISRNMDGTGDSHSK